MPFYIGSRFSIDSLKIDFLAHLSRRLKVSYCDHPLSVVVVVCPSIRSHYLNNISS